MKRFIRFIAISFGVLLALCVALIIVLRLVAEYRYARQVASISKKLAPVIVNNPQVVWNTDLRPFGFPQDNFDSPYTHSEAQNTVAMSGSLAAVAFRKSHYIQNRLITDGNLLTMSLQNGSVLTTANRPGPIGVGPTVVCCTAASQFYGFADGYFLVKDGQIIGTQANSPVGPAVQKVNVKLGYNGRPASVEIVHADQSMSSFQADCGYVMDSFVSKTTLAIIGCSMMSIIGTDGHVLFTDVFNDAYLYFGGASKNGKRFVIAVSAWHPGDPPYMTDEWLVVYDVDRRGAIIAFKSDSLPYQQSQSALSAEGERLLIGTGGHLKLVRLPN
jgi:hypothetical protein